MRQIQKHESQGVDPTYMAQLMAEVQRLNAVISHQAQHVGQVEAACVEQLRDQNKLYQQQVESYKDYYQRDAKQCVSQQEDLRQAAVAQAVAEAERKTASLKGRLETSLEHARREK